jgi:hypothetical protein
VITDWRGEYFANPTLAGEPALIRNDTTIDFFWGTDAPGEGMPADRFSARWTRRLHLPEGDYRFAVTADDGVRFWIDGELYVDDWQDGPLRPHAFDLYLTEGEHALHLEFYENLGDAGVQLGWEQLEIPTATPTSPAGPTSPPADTPSPTPQSTETPKPTSVPIDTPTPIPPVPDTWHGEYFANPFLSGEPELVREDPELSFDWGTGSPGEAIPADNFSARWTREVWVQAGTYRFFLEVDDGARFWIDGQPVIEAWDLVPGETHIADVELADGLHTMQVEYFELIVDARIHLWVEKAPP